MTRLPTESTEQYHQRLNAEAAKCLGWHLGPFIVEHERDMSSDYTTTAWLDAIGNLKAHPRDWSPATNLEQAFMVQQKTWELKRWSWFVSRLCEMKPLNMDQGWWLAHAAPPDARTAAAVAASR